MRRLIPRMRESVRYFHHSPSLFIPNASLTESLLDKMTNTRTQIASPSVKSQDGLLTHRISETGGNITHKELIALKSEDLLTSSHSSTVLNKITPTHLTNLLLGINKELPHNLDLQSFVLMELNGLLKVDKECFILCMKIIKKSNPIMRQLYGSDIDRLDINSSDSECMKVLIDFSLILKNNLFAASIILTNDASKIDPNITKSVMKSLMMKNPIFEEYQLDYILRISSKKGYKFDEFEALQILEKLEHCENVILSKKVLTFLLYNTEFRTQRSKIRHCYRLIQIDSRMKNPSGCYLHWKSIMNAYDSIERHDMRIIAILLRTFNNDKYINLSKEIVERLPISSYSNTLLTTDLLEYAQRSKNVVLLNTIIGELQAPIPRPVLSQLLKVNMVFGDMNGVQTVINEIVTRSELSAKDHEIILKGLLKSGKKRGKQVLEFLGSIPVHKASQAYLLYIDTQINLLAQGKFNESQSVLIDTFINNMKYDVNHPFWGILGSLFFKYVTKTSTSEKDLLILKEIYVNSTRNYIQQAYISQPKLKHQVVPQTITYNPFAVPLDERSTIFLKINPNNRVIMVKTIIDKAIRYRSCSLLDWGCHELINLGLTVQDIQIDINKKMNTKLQKIGFEEEKNLERFKAHWKQRTLHFMKDRKVFELQR